MKVLSSENSLRLLMRPNLVYLISTIGRVNSSQYVNVAPFGLVMEVSHTPARVALSLKHNTDTFQNIVQGRDFVLNVCDSSMKQIAISCSSNVPRGISEIDFIKQFKLELTPFCCRSIDSQVPGLMESPINIWCRLIDGKILTLDEGRVSNPLQRSLLVADVLGTTCDREVVAQYCGVSRLLPEMPLLLHYGAGVYGETRCTEDHPCELYPRLLSEMNREISSSQVETVDQHYSNVPMTEHFEIQTI